MTETKFYANVVDLSEIPEPILKLAMNDWFDKNDVVVGKQKIDDGYVRVVGKNMEQIEARVEILKTQNKVRNGSGVRIKKKK